MSEQKERKPDRVFTNGWFWALYLVLLIGMGNLAWALETGFMWAILGALGGVLVVTLVFFFSFLGLRNYIRQIKKNRKNKKK